MTRVALYTRVSTKEQVEGLSLETQSQRLTTWAERESWDIVAVYQDAGYSGRNTNRPAFQQMLLDAERRKFDFLLARVRERVFRNALDARVYADRLREYGVQIKYLDEPEMDDTPASFLVATMQEGYAEYFSRDASYKIKLGLQGRLASGRSLGRPPLGYNPDWSINTDDSEIVKDLFERYASGKYSQLQLSEWLGGKLQRRVGEARVQRTLKNPIYVGKIGRAHV